MNNRPFLTISVDDNPGDNFLIKRALLASDSPIYFHSFLSSRAFLTYIFAQENLPSLIFLDINIPVIDGFEILTILKKDPRLNAIPKIVMSSSSNLKDIYKSYRYGANCFVVKPLSYADLQQTIKSIVSFWLKPYSFNYNFIKYVNFNISY
jgi:CheY-like chemotaxis protein